MTSTRRSFLASTSLSLAAIALYEAPRSSADDATFPQRIYRRALEMKGSSYVWGGESLSEGGFDCSGLLQWAYRAETGVVLPRVAADQATSPYVRVLSRNVPINMAKGTVKPMQVVFFHHASGDIGHVAIATGGDTFFGANYFSADAVEQTFYVASNGVNTSTFTRYSGINVAYSCPKDRTSRPYTHVTIAEWVTPDASSITRHVKSGMTLNVRSSASTSSSIVGQLSAGSSVSGVISNEWMKLTSGAYVGRYVSATYLS